MEDAQRDELRNQEPDAVEGRRAERRAGVAAVEDHDGDDGRAVKRSDTRGTVGPEGVPPRRRRRGHAVRLWSFGNAYDAEDRCRYVPTTQETHGIHAELLCLVQRVFSYKPHWFVRLAKQQAKVYTVNASKTAPRSAHTTRSVLHGKVYIFAEFEIAYCTGATLLSVDSTSNGGIHLASRWTRWRQAKYYFLSRRCTCPRATE